MLAVVCVYVLMCYAPEFRWSLHWDSKGDDSSELKLGLLQVFLTTELPLQTLHVYLNILKASSPRIFYLLNYISIKSYELRLNRKVL